MYHFKSSNPHTLTLVSDSGEEQYKNTTLQGTYAFKLRDDPDPAQ